MSASAPKTFCKYLLIKVIWSTLLALHTPNTQNDILREFTLNNNQQQLYYFNNSTTSTHLVTK